MNLLLDTAQAAVVTGALCLAARALVTGIREEYAEVYHYWRGKCQ